MTAAVTLQKLVDDDDDDDGDEMSCGNLNKSLDLMPTALARTVARQICAIVINVQEVLWNLGSKYV